MLLVAPSLDIIGGQAVQANQLLLGLKTLEDIRVSFLPVNPRLPGVLRHLQRVKYLRTIVTFPFYLASLVANVWKADVIHAFSAGYWSFLLAPAPAILAARFFGKKVLLNYHTGEADDHLGRHRRIALPLIKLAHLIVVPSGYLVGVFFKHGLTAHAVANFVDPTEIPFRERTGEGTRFLSNRNFEWHYNVACLIRAFAEIQKVIPSATLTLVGDGSCRRGLEALVRELGLKEVEFTGPVHPAAMGPFYDRADVYLNSPDVDNMPMSVIEAFAAGLPVVSTNAGGIPWILRHDENGLVVPANDDKAMATSALRLCQERGLSQRLTGTARQDVLLKYTWEAVGPDWHRIYDHLHRG